MSDHCGVCGAYWPCEHRRTPESDGLRYIAPDSPTLAQRQQRVRDGLDRLAAALHAASANAQAATASLRALGDTLNAVRTDAEGGG